MQSKIGSNRLIKELFLTGVFTKAELKRVYRGLCKKTHPDLTGKDSKDFLSVQEEYCEAKKYVGKLKKYQELGLIDKSVLLKNPRKEFYRSLDNYTSCGMHSIKVRLRPDLKERNFNLLKQVIHWSKLYDRRFIPVFIDYNRPYLQSYSRWRVEKRIHLARKMLIKGLYSFFNYQKSGTTGDKRTALSYFDDAGYELSQLEENDFPAAILKFLNWFIIELEKPPAAHSDCVK